MRLNLPTLGLGLLCTTLLAVAAYWQLDECLWNDEIYTLKHFVLPGWAATLGDYHVPNNHILSNVLHGTWLRVLGIGDLGTLLDSAWKIRLLPLLLSVTTVLLAFRVARRTWGQAAGWAAALILLTTLAFANFGFQVRGYPLSLLAATGLLGAAMRVITSGRCDWRVGLLLTISTAALLYTIPSNLYFVGSVGVALVVAMGKSARRTGLAASTYVAAGGLLAIVLYWPVLSQVTDNEYIASGRAFKSIHWDNLRLVVTQFVGWRWLLLPVVGWGLWLAWSDSVARRQLILLGAAFFGPFLWSALRGDEPPPRTFVVQLPAFVWLATLGWHHVCYFFSEKKWHPILPLAGIAVCVASLFLTQKSASKRIKNSLVRKEILQDIDRNYYQYWYEPNAEFDLFKEKIGPSATLVLEGTEPHDLPNYLDHKGLHYVPLDSIYGLMERQRTVCVCTKFAGDFTREIQKMPEWTYSYLQPQARYPRIVICRRK
jgi:hypothetical protein